MYTKDAVKASPLCVYCGSQDGLTSDHVPPKNIFPKPRPALITVPSCRGCNGGASLDDEYFFSRLVMFNGVGSHPDGRKGWQRVYRNLGRPEARGFKASLFDSLGRSALLSESGDQLGNVVTFGVDAKRQSRVVARTIRGIYYDRANRVLLDHYVLAYPLDFLTQKAPTADNMRVLAQEAMKLTSLAPQVQLGGNIFACWWHEIDDFSLWALVFFGRVPFFGFTIPKSQLRGGHHGYGFP